MHSEKESKVRSQKSEVQPAPSQLSTFDFRLSTSAVIFDIGATLVTGPPVAPNKVIAGLLSSSKDATAAEVASVIMTTPLRMPEEAYAALESRFGPLDRDAVAGIRDLWNAQARAAREIDGATDTVLALKKRGLKIGLLSDIWTPYYRSVERAIPRVIKAADAIVLSFQTGSRKPEPANFLRILQELGVEPGEVIMVGDTYEHDILPALQLGMRAVWVLARPDRETDSIIRVLNGDFPSPTLTVPGIAEVAEAGIFQHSTLNTQHSTFNIQLPS